MRRTIALALLALLTAGPAGAVGELTCYKAKDLKQPKFAGTTLPLLSDAFSSRSDVEVKKPYLLCSPSSVDEQGAEAPGVHLACYKTKPNKLAAPVNVEMADALGTVQVEIKKGNLVCVPAGLTVHPQSSSGSLLMLTYNVAGLPEGLSGSHPETNMPLIAPRLNAYDLVLVQESWKTPDPNPFAPLRVYHEILEAGSTLPFRSIAATHPFGTDPLRPSALLGDGLNRFARFRFDSVDRQRWTGCHDTAADCLALKGFSMSRTVLPTGGVVDVYNLHMEAGGAPEDDALRDAAVTQMVAYMNTHSSGNAVIMGGDFNLHTDEEPDATIFERLLDEAGLTDTCAALACADPGRIDKIVFRSSAAITLTPVSYSVETANFLDGDDESLSDHEPVAVRFNWTVTP